jgi:hypothetical protein
MSSDTYNYGGDVNEPIDSTAGEEQGNDPANPPD